MGFLDFLFGKTPKLADEVPDFEITVGNVILNKDTMDPATYQEVKRQLAENGVVDLTITLPDEDAEPDADHKPRRESDAVEPFFCTIDYTDAQGNRSRRRITTRAVRRWGENSIIIAYCHERQALRYFRIDRISRIVTFDGEVFSAMSFAKDLLGLDLWQYSASPERRATGRKFAPVNFSRYTSAAVLVLTATAKADEHLHPEESEVILRYLEDEAFALNKAGILEAIPEPSAFDVIGRRINRLRPTREDLADALAALRGRPTDQVDRLKRTIAQVITADGVVHLSEETFLGDLDRLLALSETTAWAELDRLVAAS